MAQLSTKIKLYCEANGVSNVNFMKDDVMLQDNLDGKGAFIASWNLSIAQPTMEQLNSYEAQATIYENNQQIIANRKKAYGTIEQQIEFITENGVSAWQEKVNQIKLENPKE
jgi:hypothetical protein